MTKYFITYIDKKGYKKTSPITSFPEKFIHKKLNGKKATNIRVYTLSQPEKYEPISQQDQKSQHNSSIVTGKQIGRAHV